MTGLKADLKDSFINPLKFKFLVQNLEKNKDIGIYKTLGINRKQIKKIFLNQNYILSLTSSAISIIMNFSHLSG